MDHRDIIASLTPEQRDRLTQKSDAAGLGHLAVHWGLIILLGTLIAMRVPLWWALVLPQGILIVFLFTLLHEAVHRTPFASEWLNDWVARASGFMLVLGADWFRYFHFAHHRYTQDPDNDPELSEPEPETVMQYIVHVSGLPVWWGQVKGMVANALGGGKASYIPPKGEAKVRREAQVILALYAVLGAGSIWLGTDVLLWMWIVPAILGQPFLRLYLLAEHGRCPFVANMLENTRTTATNRVVRRLAWNMPYHAEHHSYPSVPFHKLPEFHDIVENHLKVTEDGYVRFNAKYLEGLR
jgi:fatty acid desaturase